MYKTVFLWGFRYAESTSDVNFSILGQGHVNIKMSVQRHIDLGTFKLCCIMRLFKGFMNIESDIFENTFSKNGSNKKIPSRTFFIGPKYFLQKQHTTCISLKHTFQVMPILTIIYLNHQQ